MFTIIWAIIPVFTIIIIGHIFRKKSFPGGTDFWHSIDKLVYFVLIPCLFFKLTYSADLSNFSELITLPLIIISTISIITLLMLLFRSKISSNGAEFSSMYQGSIRFNSYLSLSIAQIIFGPHILVHLAVTFALLVPLVNILSIAIIAYYAESDIKLSTPMFIKRLYTNPLIISCLSGFLCNQLELELPYIIFEICDILSRAALPLGLLSVGAGLKIRYLKDAKRSIFITSAIKLIAFVFIATSIALMMDIKGEMLHLIILFAALPSPPSAYILAKQMGGDVPTMSGIIVFQTFLSAFSITFFMALAHYLGAYQ